MYWYQREAFLDQQLEGTDFVRRDRKGGGGVKERETERWRESKRESPDKARGMSAQPA